MKCYPKDSFIKLNRSPHSPHMIISNLILPGTSVLDLGCNTGMLGRLLAKKKVTIDGVDINPKVLKRAQPYYRHLYQKDLSQKLNLKGKYDYVVMSDILEHLAQPCLLIKESRKLLKKDGHLIVSLPNIARLEIRLKFLLGHFDYLPGILSPDHLRHFTFKSGRQLIENGGFQVIKKIPTGFGHMIKVLPRLFAFQFVYVAKVKKLRV